MLRANISHMRPRNIKTIVRQLIKLFNPDETRSKHMARFCKKLERLTPVSGLIKFYHAGYWKERNCYYMVMEYVEGDTLYKSYSKKVFPMFKGINVVRHLFEILCDCHSNRICLGDLHTENILIDDDGGITIIDCDLSCKFTPENVKDDIVSICKIFYEITGRKVDYPQDLRNVIPLKENVIRDRYGKVIEVLCSLEELLGA